MLRSVSAAIEHLPLARPFRISRGVKTVADVVTVKIGQGDVVGAGEAVPYSRYGETVESVLAQIGPVEAALIDGATRDEVQSLLPAGAARNAVDCALWDLEARLAGKPLADTILGGPLRPTVTAMTISLDTPDKMGEAARALSSVELVKVKVNDEAPELALRAVRDALPTMKLIVDPNESWNMALLERLQPLLRDLAIDFVEQPLPAEDDHVLEGFEPLVPICADESCHTADDLEVLARRYGMVNIKLDKTGGLTEALKLYEAARARDFGVMIGCMICSSLSIAPALLVAARTDYADLDGPLWLSADRPGGVALSGGRLTPPAPGFWG
jgi:L-alanine-DL-glutamate epimerase-like enolase superfamily enzyme